ncbi:ABC transporter permease [Pyxidicoccus parkwayensis]|uniref:ABC transporter permease n=1 Tax=Pyxidicoccus parkwayensis TaxID=2813578 RepID=A0ABX7P671_9BACT|nr:ABC transporter permease [Pyxidicoccus parkwaysis]QSQ25964.1 ABC transporter permease [Pyxidicoccus parkwaysis]
MDTLAQDLRLAVRRLRRGPTFTLVALATLALGIGANVSIFSVVHAVLLRPLPMHDDARLVRLYSLRTQGPGPTSPPDLLDLREQTHAFDGLVGVANAAMTLGADGPETSPQKVQAGLVSPEFFRVLGVSVPVGRALQVGDDAPGAPKVAVLSYALWQRRFGGDPSVLGRSFSFGGPEPWTVVGVAAPGFDFPSHAEVWFPLLWDDSMRNAQARGAHWLELYGRLAPGVSLEQARADASEVARRLAEQYPATNSGKGVSVQPLRDVLVGNVRPSLLLLLGAVGLVLLIACANLTHLLLARAASREGELSVRLALGASRGRLARELLIESAVLSVLGGGAGLLAAMWALDAMAVLGPRDIPRIEEVSLDGTVLAFTAGLSVLTTFLFGLVPALHASRADPGRGLRAMSSGSGGSAHRHRTRSTLIVVETSLAVLLLVSAGLLLRSFLHQQHADLGFRPEGVLTVKLDLPPRHYRFGSAEPAAFYERLLERVRAMPGVQSAGLVSGLPMDGVKWTIPMRDPVRPVPQGTEPWQTRVRMLTPGALETLGAKVMRGRGLVSTDVGDSGRVVLINAEAARRFWPGEDPIGHTVETDMGWGNGTFGGRVVGVVEDLAIDGPAAPAAPELFVPYDQARSTEMTLLLRTSGEPLTLLPSVRAEVRALDPALALGRARTLSSVTDGVVAPLRFYLLLVGLFAGAALMLAAVGLYGVVTYAVLQRTRELGIRMALGAREQQVMRMVLGHYLRLTAVGLVLGLALAMGVSRALTHLLSGVLPTDPLTYGVVVVVLGGVAFLATLLPARRASRVSPAIALRGE